MLKEIKGFSIMKYQGLALVSCWFLACTPVQTEEGVSTPSSQREILDPDAYTITAYVMSVPFPDQKSAAISGRWLDSAGEFSKGNDFSLSRFRHTLSSAQRYQPLQFSFTLNNFAATSESISFKDCDFATNFGYASADFRHMLLSYTFLESTTSPGSTSVDTPTPTSLTAGPILERGPLNSSGPDAKAVQCERVTSAPVGRVVNLKLSSKFSEPIHIESKGQTVTPLALTRESFFDSVTQEFAFDLGNGPVAQAGQDISVRTKTGTYSYRVSFKSCIDMVSNKKDQLTSQRMQIAIDSTGKISTFSDLLCCWSDSTCGGSIAVK